MGSPLAARSPTWRLGGAAPGRSLTVYRSRHRGSAARRQSVADRTSARRSRRSLCLLEFENQWPGHHWNHPDRRPPVRCCAYRAAANQTNKKEPADGNRYARVGRRREGVWSVAASSSSLSSTSRSLEAIFARCWLSCATRADPAAGRLLYHLHGEDPVLVIRDTQGQVRAFLNVCRHRGNRLCRAEFGNAASFTCAYHGWTYRNDGRLVRRPLSEGSLSYTNWSESAGVSLRWRSSTITKGCCSPPSTRGAAVARISRRDDLVSRCLFRTAARAASRSSAACTNGSCRAIGSSPPRTSAANGYHTSWSHLSAIQNRVRRRLPRQIRTPVG